VGWAGVVEAGACEVSGVVADGEDAAAWVERFVDLAEELGCSGRADEDAEAMVRFVPVVGRDVDEFGDGRPIVTGHGAEGDGHGVDCMRRWKSEKGGKRKSEKWGRREARKRASEKWEWRA